MEFAPAEYLNSFVIEEIVITGQRESGSIYVVSGNLLLERGFSCDDAEVEHIFLMGEFDDGALMKAFGQAGAGFFPAPALLSEEICARYAVRLVGQTDSVRESFWLVSAERRISHPAIRLLIESAHDVLSVTHRPSNAS